jgi:glycosyltransferase involved in cell wall biosynthesis
MQAPTQRLAVVVSHPIQYYAPWFRWMTARGWTLRVFYLWDAGVAEHKDREFGRTIVWDVDLLSGYEAEFVSNIAREPGTHHLRGLNNPALGPRLQAWKPDAILLFGYNYRTHLRLLLAPPAPLIFRGDSHLLDSRAPRRLKRWALRLVYGRCAAITYVGQANRDYFRAFGVPPEKLFHAPHCVDAGHFTPTSETRATAETLRASLGLQGKRIVLFAGKLIPKKRPLELLQAFHALSDANAALVIVGEGSERSALQHLAATRPELHVRFLPFANQSEMPSRYLLADVFALPSGGPEETWGLAVNEAMHAGVPCLVSDRVGCQRDLVTEGETGWAFPADAPTGQHSALEEALRRALADTARDAAGFRQRVLDRIAGYTYATATAGLAQAVQSLGQRQVV